MTHMPSNSTNFRIGISARSAFTSLAQRARGYVVRAEGQKMLARMVGVLLAGLGIAFGAASISGSAQEGQVLIGGPDNNKIAGGPGIDMAAFSGSRWAYVILRIGDQVVVIGPDGEDRLTNVEVLHFDDMTLNLAAALSRKLTNGVVENIPVWRIGQ